MNGMMSYFMLLNVNQSEVRQGHDERHDVLIPHLEGPPRVEQPGSPDEEVGNAPESFLSEHVAHYHLCCDRRSVDCVEDLISCSGIGAYLSHQGQIVTPAVSGFAAHCREGSSTAYSFSSEEPRQL